jgi:hypothetical protein
MPGNCHIELRDKSQQLQQAHEAKDRGRHAQTNNLRVHVRPSSMLSPLRGILQCRRDVQ